MAKVEKRPPPKREKKTRDLPKRKVDIDVSVLPDAIVDGKLRVKLKGEVVFERTLNGRTKLHEGHVAGVRDGIVEIWDSIQDQFWIVELKNPPTLLKAKSRDQLEESTP